MNAKKIGEIVAVILLVILVIVLAAGAFRLMMWMFS